MKSIQVEMNQYTDLKNEGGIGCTMNTFKYKTTT